METPGRDREDDHHDEMRRKHPCLSYEDDAPKRVIGLCSGSMDRLVHSYIQSSLVEDVSFHGDILPRRPLDQQWRRDASHVEEPFIDFRGVECSEDHLACMILKNQHMRRCIDHVQME